MQIHRLVWLFICLLSAETSFGVRVEREYEGLTSIPEDIDPNVYLLNCKYNEISNITKSDFNDKYPNLQYIFLTHNEITTVESGCFKGTALREMTLMYNQLTFFPDFRKVKDTLEVIDLYDNRIHKISRAEIDYLTKISEIYLSCNPLVQLPQFTRLLPSLSYLYLIDIELECCSQTIWLKRQPDTLYVRMSSEPCSHPSQWSMMNWDDITEDMLLQHTCGERF
ncbi:hypothetical protein CAPTEDRAFT_192183 [Capitella teleta]|uniref:LRRCT domain-containing protein n=1 Tax=Capitella teleta TaxID=283909 RepID=R7TV72_CAPTE|nr:hypothetical protein CAPTEDRAFT_192183 [Capitella teleta]|eukprot:ELT94905.1 hypothetical protein CAPTEDRAFT_192183 [Capitella teleta]